MLKDEEQQQQLAVVMCGLNAIGIGGWLLAVVGRRQVRCCQDSSHHCAA